MEAPKVFDKQPPPIRFSLSTAIFVLAVICVLLVEYQVAGVEAFPAWGFTLLLAGIYLLHRLRAWTARNIAAGAFLILGFWVSLPSLARPSWHFQQMDCVDRLKVLGKATSDYEIWNNSPRTLPQCRMSGSGTEGLSWRVSLLPYLDHDKTYKKFNLQQGWQSGPNRPLADIPIAEYRCPAEMNSHSNEASYVTITGDDTCWPVSKSISSAGIKDGTSNTILFTETHDSGILWPEPRDLEYDTLDWRIHGTPANSISSSHGPVVRYFDGSRKLTKRTGVNIVMADGSTRRLMPDVDPEVLRQMANRRDGLPKPEDMP
jgi:hypothetical protein